MRSSLRAECGNSSCGEIRTPAIAALFAFTVVYAVCCRKSGELNFRFRNRKRTNRINDITYTIRINHDNIIHFARRQVTTAAEVRKGQQST